VPPIKHKFFLAFVMEIETHINQQKEKTQFENNNIIINLNKYLFSHRCRILLNGVGSQFAKNRKRINLAIKKKPTNKTTNTNLPRNW
jgi:hypothetical protein